MAGAHRGTSADLNRRDTGDMVAKLLAEGRAFSFFQAMRLLRHRLRQTIPEMDAPFSDQIQVRPKLSLAFPSADIDRIEMDDINGRPGYHVTATFLGLYGTASPLPTFYTEDLLEEASQDENVSREFIDILNQRLYDLLFQGWMKYRLFLQVAEERNGELLERLFCLLGLGSAPLRGHSEGGSSDYKLLRYIGLFTQFPRSAAGLSALLGDALPNMPLQIIPCILRKASIPDFQKMKIGVSGSRLGTDSYLGAEIEDRMGKFCIQIGPLELNDFLDFMPGRSGYATLTTLTEIYLTEPLAYEVELILAAQQAKTVCLGDPVRALLGVTSWVFSEAQLGEKRTRFTVNRRP